jgi:hypothetical protein
MLRPSLARAILRLALCSIVPGGPAWAKKPAADPLAPTRARLDALESCLGGSDALKTLRKGLLWGWAKEGGPPTLLDKQPAPPPGPEYSESLETDVKACRAAAQIQDEEKRELALSTIRKDIEIKAADCRKFGMSRKVPVVISTVRGDKVESGWQVFYQWSCASLLEPLEIRVPQLTSPANVDLPPGAYSFRAEKKNAEGQVETVGPTEIEVGSAQWIPLELAIP